MTTKLTTRKELIQSDIRNAKTLPADYYRSQQYFDLALDRIFARSWQLALDVDQLPPAGSMTPYTLLEGCLDEPLLYVRDGGGDLRCMSNVCTHRASVIVQSPCTGETLRCPYHGRRFSADGMFISAPGFECAENFPSASDNLPSVQLKTWGPFTFVAADPAFSFDQIIGDVTRRLHWLMDRPMKRLDNWCVDHTIDANWAIYVENYLEGLHVPFVHPALATALDTKDYRMETHAYSNLQIGMVSKPDGFALDIPDDSPEHGSRVLAYYYWLFPNMMFNFYPWGVSVNVIVPLAVNKTKVRYLTYMYDESKLGTTSPESIATVEREDQAIVESVQRGMRSRLYKNAAGMHLTGSNACTSSTDCSRSH